MLHFDILPGERSAWRFARTVAAVQGTIAQIIVLTTHGNAFLRRSPRFDLSDFYPSHGTFKFCEYVRFADLKPKGEGWEQFPYASDPKEWLMRLQREGVRRLRMIYASSAGAQAEDTASSDRMLVGFVGGGGRWVIEAMKASGSDYWEGSWDTGDQERADQKIWQVTYGRIASDQPAADGPDLDPAALRNRLAENLQAIGDFARMHKLDNFARAFDGGLAQLNSSRPHESDFAPDGALSLPAAQLLGAVQTAWVFGGMGSWNDMGFDGEDQVTYDRLSEELYQLLNAAMVAAANSNQEMHPPQQAKANPKPWWKIWN